MATTLTFTTKTSPRTERPSLVARTLGAVWAWRRRMRNRAELRRVLERADDRLLADIGLTRAGLADEAGKPFWEE